MHECREIEALLLHSLANEPFYFKADPGLFKCETIHHELLTFFLTYKTRGGSR